MKRIYSKIVSNERLNKNSYHMVFEAIPIASEAKPGQFINMKPAHIRFPLFRRPLSIFRCVKLDKGIQGIEVVYKLVGPGTKIMASLRPGDEIDIIGPLGHGFEWKISDKNIVLLGGGIGSATLFMLAEEISRKVHDHGINLNILLGAASKDEVLLEKEFKTLSPNVSIATDDGTYGYHGVVTEMLKDLIHSNKISSDCIIYSCGPEAMLQSLTPICKQYGITAQISIERPMMCGMGACLSCVCKVDKTNVMKRRDLQSSYFQFGSEEEYGYALVCKDGPVFYLDEVIQDE